MQMKIMNFLHMIELRGKGEDFHMELLPLHPLRDVRRVRGNLSEILENASPQNREDYISITLTDEIDPYRPKEQLEKVYTHILEIRMDNARTRKRLEEFEYEAEITDPLTVFHDFYKEMQGKEMSSEEQKILEQIFERAKGE